MSKVKSSGGEGLEISLSWQDASNGHIPQKAVNAGSSYVARAIFNGEYIPGKVVHGFDSAFISHGGKEIPVEKYQVLVDTQILGSDGYEWKHASGNNVPKGAVIGGVDNGRPLYIGRAEVDGTMTSGKFEPHHGSTFIPYGGVEHCKKQSEILCFSKKDV